MAAAAVVAFSVFWLVVVVVVVDEDITDLLLEEAMVAAESGTNDLALRTVAKLLAEDVAPPFVEDPHELPRKSEPELGSHSLGTAGVGSGATFLGDRTVDEDEDDLPLVRSLAVEKMSVG